MLFPKHHLAGILFQVSYVIGYPKPLSISVNTFESGKKTDSELIEIIQQKFDLRPSMIMR